MTSEERYLRLVNSYCAHLGELRWSTTNDAIEYPGGETFALTEEIALFLEGFASVRALIHFSRMLHLLDVLRGSLRTLSTSIERLRVAFHEGGRSLRNAGVFWALACPAPPYPETLNIADLSARLQDPTRPIRWYVAIYQDTFEPTQLPGPTFQEFEQTIESVLDAYTTDELIHWFRHGRGTIREPAAKLATLIMPRPRSLLDTLAELLARPRLSGARPFVSQLLSALALPAPRRLRQEMPVGGYADVTTRGTPERLLLSQFALDDADFIRRFAENELLYFRREEPHAPVRRRLVILLDQGVRTWGDVRLTLAAAVLALGRQADRKSLQFLVAATSNRGELLDPVTAGTANFGGLVEASDLSANPAEALARVLEKAEEKPTDVVLLTHPRNLREPEVRTAGRCAGERTRLFGVAMDAEGAVELAEFKRGIPVPWRKLQLNLTASAETPAAPRARTPSSAASWDGDLEAMPFPFRFGTTGKASGLADFDASAKRLLTISSGPVIHLWDIESDSVEVLPRPAVNGVIMCGFRDVMGVAGGFVVHGRIADKMAVAHYDVTRRSCAVFTFSEIGCRCEYFSDRHAVLFYDLAGRLVRLHHLYTGNTVSCLPGEVPPPHANEAWSAAEKRPRSRSIPIEPPSAGTGTRVGPHLEFHAGSGTITWCDGTSRHLIPHPRGDGRPALQDCRLWKAQIMGTTLALGVARSMRREPPLVYVSHGPHGPRSWEPVYAAPNFTLSRDGLRLCRQTAADTWTVNEVGETRSLFSTRSGGHSTIQELALADGVLLIRNAARHFHLVYWRGSALERKVLPCSPSRGVAVYFRDSESGEQPVWAHTSEVPKFLRDDAKRFIVAARGRITAVGDRYGHVAIFDGAENLICMFFAFRKRLAGWMPDGTYLGPADLTGCPVTADAPWRMARALQAACGMNRS